MCVCVCVDAVINSHFKQKPQFIFSKQIFVYLFIFVVLKGTLLQHPHSICMTSVCHSRDPRVSLSDRRVTGLPTLVHIMGPGN